MEKRKKKSSVSGFLTLTPCASSVFACFGEKLSSSVANSA